MIKMIAGVYGLPVKQANGKVRVIGKGPDDGPFSTAPEREAELVKNGLARYVGEPEPVDDGEPIGFSETPPELPELPDGVIGVPEYSVDMKADELREIGKLCGLTFKVGMTKAEMVEALDAHIEANTVLEDEDEFEDEDAPDFDAAGAVL